MSLPTDLIGKGNLRFCPGNYDPVTADAHDKMRRAVGRECSDRVPTT